MANKKYSYYVGYLKEDGTVGFVTSVNYREKTWLAKNGEKALEMSMSEADSIVFGMLMNYTYAFTVKVPHGIEFTNPIKEEKGE